MINDKEISVHPTSSAPARVVAGAAEVVISLGEAPGAPQWATEGAGRSPRTRAWAEPALGWDGNAPRATGWARSETETMKHVSEKGRAKKKIWQARSDTTDILRLRHLSFPLLSHLFRLQDVTLLLKKNPWWCWTLRTASILAWA